MAYWQDVHTRPSSEAPLGRIKYLHVHDDGTVHPTRISTPPDRGWVSMVGDKPPVGVLCLGCGLSMRESDPIEIVFETGKEG